MIKKTVFMLVVAISLSSCGSSGGGSNSNFIGAAILAIFASPTQLDTGDRTQVRVFIREVHDDGIALKLRYPDVFSYVAGTAEISVGGQEFTVAPDFEGESEVDREDMFLVFYLESTDFERGQGELVLQLSADDSLREGMIEVDADIDTGEDFDPSAPQFTAQDGVSVGVRSET